MINKRGALFAVYIVFLTLFFCTVSVMMFFVEQEKGANSLVSPMDVLVVQDDLEVFEMLEKDLIEESFSDASAGVYKFGSAGFLDDFRSSFLNGVDGNSFMKEFMFKDLILNWTDIEDAARSESMPFIKNVLYPSASMKYDDSSILIARATIGKSFVLFAKDESKIHFPVRFNFEFDRKYSISKEGVVKQL